MADIERRSSGSSQPNQRTVDRAISLIRKAEVKSVPREKIRDFLKRKNLNDNDIVVAYKTFFDVENIVEIEFPSRPLGFSVVMDPQGKNAVVSSIQNDDLITQHGLEAYARIVKVDSRWVEHKKHQDIIDYILDKECPITFSFRKRKHPTRGSLFQAVKRPSRSQPALKSSQQRGSTVMATAPIIGALASASKGQRGSIIVNRDGPGNQAQRGSMLAPSKNMFNPNNIDHWEAEEMENEANDMKAMMAAMAAGMKAKTPDMLNHNSTNQDDHLKNLSSRTKRTLHAFSTGNFDDIEDDDVFGKEMFDLWATIENETGGEGIQDDQDFNATVLNEVKELREQARNQDTEIDLDLDDVPQTRARMNSAPVYSNDALITMHKGTAIMKYGRRGSPKFRIFQLSNDNQTLMWFSDKKNPDQTRIDIEDMTQILKNITHDSRRDEDLVRTSFAILYGDDQSLRLTCRNETEAYLWIEGLTELIRRKDANEPLSAIKHIVLDKQPDLNLHRRQSLAQIMEGRTGTAGQNFRKRNVKNVEKEVRQLRRNYEKVLALTETDKFQETFAMSEPSNTILGGQADQRENELKQQELSNIMEMLESVRSRIEAMEMQIPDLGEIHPDIFDGALDQLKTDSWNAAIDVMALKIKVTVMASKPVEL